MNEDERLSCTHISGFVGKYFNFPALRESARFLLINAQTFGGRVAEQERKTPVCPFCPQSPFTLATVGRHVICLSFS
jgi:hypothetical protein